MATSASSFVTTRAGAIRIVLGPHPRNRIAAFEGQFDDAVTLLRAILFGLLILHDFDADHQPAASNIAHQFVLVASQPCASACGCRLREILANLRFSITSSVASAAAMQTGFPPKVEACEPGIQSMISARHMVMPSGMPDAIPFAMQIMSG